MAGSLNHLISSNGSFSMDLIENMGDAHEALEECFNIIVRLSRGDMKEVSSACTFLGYVDPYDPDDVSGEDLPGSMC